MARVPAHAAGLYFCVCLFDIILFSNKVTLGSGTQSPFLGTGEYLQGLHLCAQQPYIPWPVRSKVNQPEKLTVHRTQEDA